MSREAHVRFWEGAGVRLPRAARLPLERQVRIMRPGRPGDRLPDLWDQINALAQVLEPSQAALTRYVLSAEVLGADETWRRVMVQPKAKAGGPGPWPGRMPWSIGSSTAGRRKRPGRCSATTRASSWRMATEPTTRWPRESGLYAGALLGARAAQVRRGRALCPRPVATGPRPHRAAVRRRGPSPGLRVDVTAEDRAGTLALRARLRAEQSRGSSARSALGPGALRRSPEAPGMCLSEVTHRR